VSELGDQTTWISFPFLNLCLDGIATTGTNHGLRVLIRESAVQPARTWTYSTGRGWEWHGPQARR